LKHSKCWFTKG